MKAPKIETKAEALAVLAELIEDADLEGMSQRKGELQALSAFLSLKNEREK